MGSTRRKEAAVTSEQAAQLNDAERKLISCYETLVQVLREQRDELAPFEERNATKAVAALWQVANGLDLRPEQLYDIGV
jgi:hypothetical protein